MQITPITIPATQDIDRLRDSIMIALNRMAGQINRAESADDNALDIAGIVRSAKNELYNAPVHGSRLKDGTVGIAQFASMIKPVLLAATNPTLPAAAYPPGTIMYNTTNFTLYKVNAAGDTWVKMINGGTDIQGGTITGNEIYANTITAGQIAAGAIGASELYAGEIKIGGTGGKAGMFGVYNSSNEMVGFIGDSGTGFQGAFFVNLRIGGNLAAPVITASSTGVTINGAPFTLNLNNVTTTIINEAGYGAGYVGLAVTNNHTANANFAYSQVQPGVIVANYDVWMSGVGSYTSGGVQIYANPTTQAGDIMIYRGVSPGGQYTGFHVYTNSTGSYLTLSAAAALQDKIILTCTTSPSVDVVGGSYKISGGIVINSSTAFVGAGVDTTRLVGGVLTGYGIAGSGFNPCAGGTQYTGLATISQTVLSSIVSYKIRTNAGDLEFSVDNGANWSSVGSGGLGIVTSAGGVTITGYGGVITGIA